MKNIIFNEGHCVVSCIKVAGWSGMLSRGDSVCKVS